MSLNLENNPINSTCAEALAQISTIFFAGLKLGSGGFIGDAGINALAKKFIQNKSGIPVLYFIRI